MAKQKKGFIARMIEGPERAEGYARSTLPGNRWELGWDVFKTNTGKLVGLNLLTFLFFIPLFAIVFLRYMQVLYLASESPFSQNIGLGYPALPSSVGLSESIYLSANLYTLAFLPIAAAIASVGISGLMYVMRNMVWAEGVSVGSDFWAGVKKNYVTVLLTSLAYSVIMFLIVMSVSYVNYANAAGEGHWLLTVSNVMSYIMAVLFTIMYMYSLTLGVTYKLKFTQLIRNSFIMTIALIPTNIFFAAFALISVALLFLGNFFMTFGIVILLLLGFSIFALVWTDYNQWTFDKFINDRVPGAVKNRGIYSKNASEEEADFSFEKSTLGHKHIKPITDYDVEIAALPESFSRADLQRLEESKAAMRRDSDEYSERAAEEEKNKAAEDEANGESGVNDSANDKAEVQTEEGAYNKNETAYNRDETAKNTAGEKGDCAADEKNGENK